ncbi:MAG: transcriptional regulator [Zestosphaera sp.]
MSSVFELGYRYLVPSLKKRLAEIMNKELRMSEVEIARKLKITPSAVSRYLSSERGTAIDLTRFPDLDRELSKLAKDLIARDLDWLTIEARLLEISLLAMSRKYLCGLHHKLQPIIDPVKCRICPEFFSTSKTHLSNFS